jgi:hypothetical protein
MIGAVLAIHKDVQGRDEDTKEKIRGRRGGGCKFAIQELG